MGLEHFLGERNTRAKEENTSWYLGKVTNLEHLRGTSAV